MDILLMFRVSNIFRLRSAYAFSLLDPCCDNNDETLVLPSTLQNKELSLLKQWHLKIGNTDRTVGFNTFELYTLLP